MKLGRQAAQSLKAFASVFANPQLRALQVAGIGATIGAWAYGVGIIVFAYHAGGPRAVGLICFVRWALAGAAAPFVGVFVDRWSRKRLMVACDLIRLGLVGGMTAIAATGGPSLPVLVLAVITSIVSTAFGPAEAALMPSLVQSPEELTAANIVLGSIASMGMFAGPALAGLLLALSGPSAVFGMTAATFAWSALCLVSVPHDPAPERVEVHGVGHAFAEGLRTTVREPGLRLVVGLTGAQTFVAGALQVLVAVVALRLLHAGNAGVGWLNAGFGIGCLIGVLALAALAGRKRLAGDFGIGIALWGLPLALVPISKSLAVVAVLFGIAGVGNTLVDVAGMTLLQRIADQEVLGRVFGMLQSMILITLALGSLVAPALVSVLGAKGALVAVGLLLPALLVPTWPRLRAVDASARVAVEPLELLQRISIFAGLPAPVQERLASAADHVVVAPMTVVFAQGDPGDRFYAIVAGRATVEVDGAETRELGPGDFFGEIALLRDMPRTATVRAVDELQLYALDRDEFLGAVTGHAPSREAADRVIASRMPAGATI